MLVSTDPIADMLTRIRNAIAVRKSEVSVPYSKMKASIADLLKDSRFIDDVKVDGDGTKKAIIITISDGNNARITEIKRVSSPGRRLYVGASDIPLIKNGRGLVIVSTSQGLMTGRDARQRRLGGELICEVY